MRLRYFRTLLYFIVVKFNCQWTRKFPDSSKNRMLELWIAIIPQLFNSSPTNNLACSKEDNQGFQIDFWTAGLASPHWLPCTPRVSDFQLSENLIQEFFHHTVSWCLQKFAETNWYKQRPYKDDQGTALFSAFSDWEKQNLVTILYEELLIFKALDNPVKISHVGFTHMKHTRAPKS